MAEPPLLTLSDVSLSFGGDPIFSGVSLSLSAGDRLALVGRNGAGKSTLLRIAAGLVEADAGERFVQPGRRVAYLQQDPDFSGYATLADYAAADLEESERHRAEAAMDALEVRGGAQPGSASGGERRRAALARMLAGEPDAMLLDEPTNHLDIAAIEWLEERLARARAGVILISHDRALLSKVTRATLWLDRGGLARVDRGFAHFEAWRDEAYAREDAERKKLDKLIAQEARWAVEGISARRTRNQGRLRRLASLREERRSQVMRAGAAALALEAGQSTGKLVVEAKGVSKSYEGKAVVSDFSTRIARGDRVALIGPNGAGKTTLLKMLTGRLEPDAGTVRLGTNLVPAYFDQNREQLDPEATLWETLTGAAELGVSGANDQIMVRGRPTHVVGHLKNFLFDERQARGPVKALSGGERARLLLSMIMARESNLLVLDEPTNDLDVETLDLLQELLADYEGTALIVSHDRDFVDRVATSVVAFEGEGRAVEYAGGYTDHLAQRRAAPPPGGPAPKPRKPAPAEAKATPKPDRRAPKLSYAQSRRLDAIPAEIDRLTAEIAKLERWLSDPARVAAEPVKAAKAGEEIAKRQEAIAAAEEEWLDLEARREETG